MINQTNGHLATWIAALSLNPPKTKRFLKTDEGECCFGIFCRTQSLPYTGSRVNGLKFQFPDGETDPSVLSKPFAAATLNITRCGGLTIAGQTNAAKWLRDQQITWRMEKDLTALTIINDKTEITHAQMAQLLTLLAHIEATQQIECFAPPIIQ